MQQIKLISIIAIIIVSLSISFIIYYHTLQKPLPVIINNTKINKVGIKEIYPSKPDGEEWYINMNDPNHDPRTDPQTTLIKNNNDDGDGNSWKIQNTEVRLQCIYLFRIQATINYYT